MRKTEQIGDDEETLPGLGPQLSVDELHGRTHEPGEVVLTEQERAVLDLMGAQVDRYEWFAGRVRDLWSLDEIAAVLLRAPAGPGLWEAALVALSLSDEETAHALLDQWEPPVEDAELRLFHQICLSRVRR